MAFYLEKITKSL